MTLVISIAAALALGTVLELLHVPAGVLIGAMIAIAALRLSGTDAPDMPALLRLGALLIIGWDLGSRFDREVIASAGSKVVPLVLVVGAFVLMGWALAWVLWRTGAMDPVTAVLATSPGGMVQMGALTSEMEANAPLVVGFHLLRIVTVLFTVPIVSRFAGN
jgi:uncharacterized protein